jgi:hypothetical protein
VIGLSSAGGKAGPTGYTETGRFAYISTKELLDGNPGVCGTGRPEYVKSVLRVAIYLPGRRPCAAVRVSPVFGTGLCFAALPGFPGVAGPAGLRRVLDHVIRRIDHRHGPVAGLLGLAGDPH